MNWVRLGQELAAARRTRKLKQRELADLAGVSLATVQAIEGGKTFARVTPTIRALARLVGWQEGSAEAVLAGGEPTYMPAAATGQLELLDHGAPEPAERDDWAERIPLRIREEVREGQVLDSGTYDLSQKDTDVQILVMIKAPSGATPEQIREYLQVWRRAERELRKIGESGEGEPEPNTQ